MKSTFNEDQVQIDQLIKAIKNNGKLDLIKSLLPDEIDKVLNVQKQTALFIAVLYNRTDVAEYLLQQGANVRHKSVAGGTPIQIAEKNYYVKHIEQAKDMIELLSRYGEMGVVVAYEKKAEPDLVKSATHSPIPQKCSTIEMLTHQLKQHKSSEEPKGDPKPYTPVADSSKNSQSSSAPTPKTQLSPKKVPSKPQTERPKTAISSKKTAQISKQLTSHSSLMRTKPEDNTTKFLRQNANKTLDQIKKSQSYRKSGT